MTAKHLITFELHESGCVLNHFSHVQLFATLWTVARQAPLSMGLRILECVAVPPPGDLPHPGIELTSLISPALAGGFFVTITTWETHIKVMIAKCSNVSPYILKAK